MFCGIYLKAIWQEIFGDYNVKLLAYLPGANELKRHRSYVIARITV